MLWPASRPRSLGQRLALAMAGLVSAALVSAVVFGSRGLLHLHALRTEKAEISQRIAGLLRENTRLRERLHRLRTDDRSLEQRAREQLGLVRPGEIVYRFPAPPGPARSTPTAEGPPP